MKYKVIPVWANPNITQNYTYEGDGEYRGKMETAQERAIRHMEISKKKRLIKSYQIIEIQ